MKTSIKIISIPLFMFVVSCGDQATEISHAQTPLRGRIIGTEEGRPLAATVRVRSEDGAFVETDGEHPHVEYLGKRWCYTDGEFSLTTRSGSVVVEIRRGFETFPVKDTINLDNENGVVEHTFKLERWTNMQNRGYLSGDTHVHFLSPESAFLQMRGEDLHVANLLTSDFTHDAHLFTGKLDQGSTPDHSLYVGQEIRDWDMGHVCLLRLQYILDPIDRYGGRGKSNILLTPRMRKAREQKAAITWAHFSNLPGSESPVAIILGLIDAIDLITYNDPMGLPSHTGPWDHSGMDQVEFTLMRGSDLYYQYLNAGFRIPIAAGSDKMSEDIPVGCNRLYALIEGAPTYDNWIEALQAGTGFITNGPMLTFAASDHLSGDVVEFSDSETVQIRASAESLLPFGNLEIVVNGKVVAMKRSSPQNENDDAALHAAKIDTSLLIENSSWIAARTTVQNDYNNSILPRDLRVFSHANPIYFLEGGRKVRLAGAIYYLNTYLQAVRHWSGNYSRFGSPSEMQEFLELLDEAEQKLSEDD